MTESITPIAASRSEFSSPEWLVFSPKLSLKNARDAAQWIIAERAFWTQLDENVRHFRLQSSVEVTFRNEVGFFSAREGLMPESPGKGDPTKVKSIIDDYVSAAKMGSIRTSLQDPYAGIYALMGPDSSAAAIAAALNETGSHLPFAEAIRQSNNVPAATFYRALAAAFPSAWRGEATERAIADTLEMMDQVRKRTSELEAQVIESTSILQQRANDFVTKTATAEPVKYWKDKAKWHSIAAVIWIVVFVVAIVILTVLLSKYGPITYRHFVEIAAVSCLPEATECGPTDIGYAPLLALTIPALLSFWLLKHISRLFISNLARRGDAAERVAMIQTYLALTATDESKPNENERMLVIQALFRPGPGDMQDSAPQEWLLDRLPRVQERS